MPSTSKKQHNFMAAIAHSPEFAKKAGVKMEVGKHFMTADKGKKFKEGGTMKDADLAQDKALIKRAIKQHDMQEHKGGKGTTLKLASGGSFRKAADGITKTGKTKGTMIKMCMGGKAGKK